MSIIDVSTKKQNYGKASVLPADCPTVGTQITGWVLTAPRKEFPYVHVYLENGMRAILHENCVAGTTPEARQIRLHSLNVNDSLRLVVVRAVPAKDGRERRISLSERPLLSMAFANGFVSRLEVGQEYKGIVRNFLPLKNGQVAHVGVFVEIERGVTGMVHYRGMHGRCLEEKQEGLNLLKPGDELIVVVESLSVESTRNSYRIRLRQK